MPWGAAAGIAKMRPYAVPAILSPLPRLWRYSDSFTHSWRYGWDLPPLPRLKSEKRTTYQIPTNYARNCSSIASSMSLSPPASRQRSVCPERAARRRAAGASGSCEISTKPLAGARGARLRETWYCRLEALIRDLFGRTHATRLGRRPRRASRRRSRCP